jgi:hypothetical protein
LLIVSVTVDHKQRYRKGRNPFTFNRRLLDRYGLTPNMIEAFPLTALSLLPETCALDVADRGGMPFTELGELLGETREAPRQLFERTAERLKGKRETLALLRELLEQSQDAECGRTECANPPMPKSAGSHGDSLPRTLPFLSVFKHKKGRAA